MSSFPGCDDHRPILPPAREPPIAGWGHGLDLVLPHVPVSAVPEHHLCSHRHRLFDCLLARRSCGIRGGWFNVEVRFEDFEVLGDCDTFLGNRPCSEFITRCPGLTCDKLYNMGIAKIFQWTRSSELWNWDGGMGWSQGVTEENSYMKFPKVWSYRTRATTLSILFRPELSNYLYVDT